MIIFVGQIGAPAGRPLALKPQVDNKSKPDEVDSDDSSDDSEDEDDSDSDDSGDEDDGVCCYCIIYYFIFPNFKLLLTLYFLPVLFGIE